MNIPTQILPETCKIIQQGIENKLHTGFQIYVSISGETIANFGYGESQPDIPMTSDSITLWLSSGKPISAVALGILQQRGKLDWDDPVIKHIPEMNGAGQNKITLKHLLTHTSGLTPVITGWPHASWNDIIKNILKMELRKDVSPGEHAEYQPACTWFLIGEIIARTSGLTYQNFIKKEILDPLGMNETWCGFSSSDYKKNQSRISYMYASRRKKILPLEIHSEVHCSAASPGGNYRGTASNLGRFYEMLLNQGNNKEGKHILEPDTILDLISRHRTGMYDHTFQHKIDMGLGFVLDSRTYKEDFVPYGYGQYSSENCFGHGGAQSSIGFCDPDHQLVIVAISNGMAGEPRHNLRSRNINEAIYRDLNIN